MCVTQECLCVKWSDCLSQDSEGMTHPMLPLIGLYSLPSLVRWRLDPGMNKTDEPIRSRVEQFWWVSH